MAFRFDVLLDKSIELDICLLYQHQIGEYFNRGTVLAYVWDAQTQKEKKELLYPNAFCRFYQMSRTETSPGVGLNPKK
jgi:hypothetical protein